MTSTEIPSPRTYPATERSLSRLLAPLDLMTDGMLRLQEPVTLAALQLEKVNARWRQPYEQAWRSLIR